MITSTATVSSVLSSITTAIEGAAPDILTAVGAAAAAGVVIAAAIMGVRLLIKSFKSVAK